MAQIIETRRISGATCSRWNQELLALAERLPHGEFWLLAAAVVFFNVGTSAFLFLYNLFLLDLGFHEQTIGVVASALAIGSLAAALPLGTISRRLGAQRTLILCLVLLTVSFATRACLPGYPAQILSSFFAGAAVCGWSVCLFPAVADVVEERQRSTAYSILFATAIASCSVGGLAGALLPDWCKSLAIRCAGIAISAVEAKRITLLLSCLVIALAIPPAMRLRSTISHNAVRSGWRLNPFLVRFLMASACWGMAMGLFNPFVTVFFAHYLHFPLLRMGAIFTVTQFAQAATVLVTPYVLRRTGLVQGISLMQLITAAALLLLAMNHGAVQAAVIFTCFRMAMHMSEPGIQTLLMERVTADERTDASALNFMVTYVAQAASAAIAGFVFARFQYRVVLAGIAAFTIVASMLFYRLGRPAQIAGRRSHTAEGGIKSASFL
jgi:predicted MFS family arabinose efflux permease